MKTLRSITVMLLMVMITAKGFSQDKWSVEFRPGINFPTSEFNNTTLQTGFGFEVILGYRFIEHLGAYAGWGYNTFSIEDSDSDLDETGYTFGLQFIHPLGSTEALSYLLRVGAIYKHLELEDTDGDLIGDTDHGIGWEVGAGLSYRFGANWSLRPQVGYRVLSRELKVDATTFEVDVNYLSFSLGIAKLF